MASTPAHIRARAFCTTEHGPPPRGNGAVMISELRAEDLVRSIVPERRAAVIKALDHRPGWHWSTLTWLERMTFFDCSDFESQLTSSEENFLSGKRPMSAPPGRRYTAPAPASAAVAEEQLAAELRPHISGADLGGCSLDVIVRQLVVNGVKRISELARSDASRIAGPTRLLMGTVQLLKHAADAAIHEKFERPLAERLDAQGLTEVLPILFDHQLVSFKSLHGLRVHDLESIGLSRSVAEQIEKLCSAATGPSCPSSARAWPASPDGVRPCRRRSGASDTSGSFTASPTHQRRASIASHSSGSSVASPAHQRRASIASSTLSSIVSLPHYDIRRESIPSDPAAPAPGAANRIQNAVAGWRTFSHRRSRQCNMAPHPGACTHDAIAADDATRNAHHLDADGKHVQVVPLTRDAIRRISGEEFDLSYEHEDLSYEHGDALECPRECRAPPSRSGSLPSSPPLVTGLGGHLALDDLRRSREIEGRDWHLALDDLVHRYQRVGERADVRALH